MKRSSKKGIDLEAELKALHDQMALSLQSIEELLEGVSTKHRSIAKRHLRKFHSEQKRHLEHIKRKLSSGDCLV